MPDIATLTLTFPDLHVPLRSLHGVAEETTRIGDSEEMGRSWNGRAIPLETPYTLFAIRLSCEGDGVWTPAVDDLRFGTRVIVDSAVWRSAAIAPGQTFHTLMRTAARDALGCELLDLSDAADPTVKWHVDSIPGSRATFFDASTRWRMLQYRPRFDCVVSSTPRLTAELTGRRQGWSLDLEEYQ